MPVRFDRGHRDWRDIYLFRTAKTILRRSQFPPHYGNPYISVNKSLHDPEYLIGRLKRAQRLHRSTENWNNYNILKSANDGHTVGIKDNILTRNLPTTCASRVLKGFCPSQDATVTKLLEKAGMLVLAKTNMDEFGMGSHSMNSAYGPVTNGDPRRQGALSVGGSSGGSALAVALDLAHVAIGTDTGGSIRLPAAYMSLVGFKPSYGMISRYGVVPYANSLDTVGIIAKSAADIRLTFDILSQPDASDPTCLTTGSRTRIRMAKNRRRVSVLESKIHFTPAFTPREKAPPIARARARNMFLFQRSFVRRIGVPLEYNIAEMHPLVRWAWTATLSHLQTYGFEIVPISLPSTKHALSSYYVLAPAEAASNLAKYDGVRYGAPRTRPSDDDDKAGTLYSGYRHDNLGPEVQRRILLGNYSLSAGAMDNYFIQAQKIRRMVQKDFSTVFRMPHAFHDYAPVKNGVDVIIVPTAPTPPPHIQFLKDASPVESYMNDVFTVPASLAGLPAISVPGPRHPDFPWKAERAVGIQVIGQYGDDFSVIYFAQNFLTNFHNLKTLDRLQHDKVFKEFGSS
ncbi:hypothetical protein A1O3_07214 [Capronia epimyces CBS 606.96]|uniref:Glutamyl-tRNA(Gln) amidotransferase subunit A, mitochondrial n=1 Tax=Capronia epimyces CBS 606.96 TaxID=1182542 RepID=W9XVB8_9EURO|nr:uncharacterized protein A1O3_07214 [Capronia epimyces CBS 606.96]EXJ80926.1 hypothetical protein A1O3_07214 [Capronia epimyces CBS 606.96]